MGAARKKAGPRCRTIGGVVYDLTATDRKPPCGRGRPKAEPRKSAPPPARVSSPPPAAKQPDVSDIIYTYEPTPTGGGYDLIASTRSGTGVAKLLFTYPTREEARAAADVAKKTGTAPPPKRRELGAWEQGKFARARRSGLVSNDHRVREREEREREHKLREERNEAARQRFATRAPERTTLASVGQLPKRPALKASERELLKMVDKRNRAGLFYHSGHHSPNVQREFVALVQRGELKEAGPYLFMLPSYEGKGLRSMAAAAPPAPPAPPAPRAPSSPPPAPKRERPSRGKPKLPRLPTSLEGNGITPPQVLKVGDLVSYATPGTSVGTLGTVELEYGVVTEAPNYNAAREVDRRPTVKFVDPPKLDSTLRSMLPPNAYASQPGFSRHLPLSKLYLGWLAPQRGWQKPKGFL